MHFFPYIVIILIQATAKILPLPCYVCPTCREWIYLQKAGVMSWWRLKEIRWIDLQKTGVDELVKTEREWIDLQKTGSWWAGEDGIYTMEAGIRTFLENLEKQVPVEFL